MRRVTLAEASRASQIHPAVLSDVLYEFRVFVLINFRSHSFTQRGRRVLQTGAFALGLAMAMSLETTALAQSDPAQRAELSLEEAVEYACSISPIIPPPAPDSPTSLIADRAALEESGQASASGSVRLEKGNQALEAAEVTYNRETNRATAESGLRYYRPGINISAATADVNVEELTGRFTDTRFALEGGKGRGSAESVESLGEKKYELYVANYSTCPGPDKAWQLSAERIDLDQIRGRGEAFDAVLRVFEWPVLYTPYINFPIDDERHTGFLLPVFGLSERSGFELAAPYYINLAPDRDATLTPRVLTQRGFQLAGEFRYLNPNNRGRVAAEYLPSDNEFGSDRHLTQFEHIGRFGRHFGARANFTNVSDDEYFDDLGSSLSSTSQSQLERVLELTFAATGVRFAALLQNFQTLDDDDQTQNFRIEPYERLPQLRLSLLSPTTPWHVGLDAGFSNFRRDGSVDGLRYDIRPRLGLGTDRGAWFARTDASYRYTHYNLRNNTVPGADDSIDRSIASFSADSGLRFERILANGWLQTLEPRVFYLYNGFDNQDDIPVFDTGVPDLRFERLFADNRFVGNDRIGDANQITLGLTSRFIDPADGRTVLKLNLGRTYGFNPINVRLANASPIGFGPRHSDIVSNAEYSPHPNLYSGLTLQYDPDDNRFNRGSLRAGYRDETGRRLDVGYRYYRDFRSVNIQQVAGPFETLEQTDILVKYPLTERLGVFGRWNYSLENSQSVQTLGGFEYRPSCCWAVRAGWQRFVSNDQGEYDTAILLQIELTGLGRFGDDTEQLLERDTVGLDSGFNGFLNP